MAKSDYEDTIEEIGFDPNTDVEHDALGQWINKTELEAIQYELLVDYDLSYDTTQILELMDKFGISFGFVSDYSIADIIAEELEGLNGNT